MELPQSSQPPPSQAAIADLPPSVSFPMEIPHVSEEVSTTWEWGSLLDFTVDDQLLVSWDSETHPIAPVPEFVSEPPSNSGSDSAADRVRKRDPRLTCSNFLAGRIPCSCPEEDEKDEEEAAVGNKRTRTYAVGTARCQVPGCETDISELKGYHRRHRVCLRCANATSVVLDGMSKRYCQQCGKFHILSDFDEGKRSCRRKLERHNKRRRRKGAVEKETQDDLPAEDISGDGEADKDSLCLSNQVMGREVSLETEGGQVSPPCSAPSSQNIQSDSGVSNVVSGDTYMDRGKDGSKCAISSSFFDNKSSYSSMCPTGRISFKLYDWNPAEFPRRLRHQIFQWLASMPVELEGYIRPGCTILTIFIAMPQFMWEKLSEDAASYVCNLFSAPESLLSGRGTVILHLNNMVFEVLKG
ncbi:squamosa promoter-binding-like protein 7 [Macadamia integrifolia]|uniref:squamosa promoter-binding-like protein 7 n=1 Tax=Macadamia integrifolia TaxID=60698 RepID=UPI001C5013C6|nr:squamosa promoter-binding-like protein 7 [Macadamia integrifolia]